MTDRPVATPGAMPEITLDGKIVGTVVHNLFLPLTKSEASVVYALLRNAAFKNEDAESVTSKLKALLEAVEEQESWFTGPLPYSHEDTFSPKE